MCVPTYLSALPASRRTSLSTPTKKHRRRSPCLKIPWVRHGSTVRSERLPFPASPSAPGQRAETGHPRSGLCSRGACSVSGDLLTVVLGYEREHINAINYVIMSPEGSLTFLNKGPYFKRCVGSYAQMQSVGICMLTSHIALKCPAPQEAVCRSGWANFRTEEGTESLEKFSLLFIYVFNYLFQFLPPRHSYFTRLFQG